MRTLPCALAISGLDPSGGAGLFADLRAFRDAGAWGCGAVAVSTVQSTAGLKSSHPVETVLLLAQLRELWTAQRIASIKIGALGSTENVRGVTRFLARLTRPVPIVIDPVLRASRGTRAATLLESAALRPLSKLFELATLVTPNIPEAEILLGTRIESLEDAERAALTLVSRGARAALVKGGHLPRAWGSAKLGRRAALGGSRAPSAASVVDVLALGNRVIHLSSPRARIAPHGTGCTLASLIAGRLAVVGRDDDESLIAAVRFAKRRLSHALLRSVSIGAGQTVMP